MLFANILIMKKYLFLFGFFCSTLTFGQFLKVNKVLQENQIIRYTNQKLILLDFWATWCAPCIPATEQLAIFQRSNEDNVFAISISDENNEKIQSFLQRKPIELMVVSDFEGNTFAKYAITKRPFAILLNTNGDILWEGHPSDLTQKQLDVFVKKYAKLPKVNIQDILVEITDEVVKENIVVDTYVIEKVSDKFEDFMTTTNKTVQFRGSISDLIAELTEVPKFNVVSNFDDFKVDFKANEDYFKENKDEILEGITNKFNLNIDKRKEKTNAKELVVKKETSLWPSDYFIWSDNGNTTTSSYIVGDDMIQGDNLTIKQIADLLSDVRNEVYIYRGDNTKKYDWELQYKYDEFFIDGLKDSFGIEVINLNKKITRVIISKKE